MAEYIDRDAFVVAKRKQYCEDCERRKGMKNGKLRFCYEIGDAPCRSCGVDDMLGDIEDFPAADVVPVMYGEWIWEEPNSANRFRGCFLCNKCSESVYAKKNYCPNCGADMRGEEDDK